MGPKWRICPEQYFFGTNHYYYFHLPIGPFHCTKVKKKWQWIKLWGCTILVPKWSICHKQKLFEKIINIILIYHWSLSLYKNFLKNLPTDRELWDAQFLGPKWRISPYENFFSENLLISFVSFIHVYLHAKNWSQILIY